MHMTYLMCGYATTLALLLTGYRVSARSIPGLRGIGRLRQATADDVDTVMDLVRRVVPLMRTNGNLQWDDDYPNAAVFAHDVEMGQLWLAEIDDQFAGVAAITTDQDPEYAQVGWDLSEMAVVVHRLAVDPAFRGKGVAVGLMWQGRSRSRRAPDSGPAGRHKY
jgi:hypothetical protein